MQVLEKFGAYVDSLSDENPEKARLLLKAGWAAQDMKFRYMPDKRLMPADQYLAHLMMDTMRRPLQKPEEAVLVSIFTPCEMMQEVGLSPYNVEGFSCYLSGSKAERAFVQCAENEGIAETLCSYHKTFIGAAAMGLLPKPRCIVYTNLMCDANLLSFRWLAEYYNVPTFFIDVPLGQGEENVAYVAQQLRQLAAFLEENTGKTISEEALRVRLQRSRQTMENCNRARQLRADRYLPTDITTPLYCGMTNNILLGSEQELHYTEMLLHDLEQAPPARGKRIYWMHTIPFWSEAVRQELCFNEKAQIVGCELGQVYDGTFDPDKPYEAMAKRMVDSALNGSVQRRVEYGIRHAKELKADGVVWFAHWGCKHTLGGAQLAKKEFEKAGLPMLILDGDGCDRSHGGEGQTSTRLGAFLEMLEGRSGE